jgi:hypothetical protein
MNWMQPLVSEKPYMVAPGNHETDCHRCEGAGVCVSSCAASCPPYYPCVYVYVCMCVCVCMCVFLLSPSRPSACCLFHAPSLRRPPPLSATVRTGSPICLNNATLRTALHNYTAYESRFRMPTAESGTGCVWLGGEGGKGGMCVRRVFHVCVFHVCVFHVCVSRVCYVFIVCVRCACTVERSQVASAQPCGTPSTW